MCMRLSKSWLSLIISETIVWDSNQGYVKEEVE